MSGAHDSNPVQGGAAKVFASHIHAVGQRHTFSRQPKRVARLPAVDRALYGFNDAFTATTALILCASVLGCRFLAFGLALGRARLSNRLRPHWADSEIGSNPRSRTKVESAQLLDARLAPRSDQFTSELEPAAASTEPRRPGGKCSEQEMGGCSSSHGSSRSIEMAVLRA